MLFKFLIDGLYILHIALVTFDNIIFEKINLLSKISLYLYPFNIINLAYYIIVDIINLIIIIH